MVDTEMFAFAKKPDLTEKSCLDNIGLCVAAPSLCILFFLFCVSSFDSFLSVLCVTHA